MDACRHLASESGLRRGQSVTSVEQTPPQGGSYLLVLTNQLLLRRKASPVSPDPLNFHGKSICIYSKSINILATNPNVTYNTGQSMVGHMSHLSELAVAQRLLLLLCSQTTPSSGAILTLSPLCWAPRTSGSYSFLPFPGFTPSLCVSLKWSFIISVHGSTGAICLFVIP